MMPVTKLHVRKILVWAGQLMIILVIFIAMLEGIVLFSVYNSRMSLIPIELTRNIYERHIRKVIQMEPDCYVYDNSLTYRLKPGECVFSIIESTNHYKINSKGLRDDEKSLDSPEIISIGDSFAMGWGVDQEESYGELLERSSGMRLLNAGIASYGTVRETQILKELDTSRLKYLILQYTDNDIRENKLFFELGRHTTTPPDKWQRAVNYYNDELSYYPGKFSVRVMIHLLSGLRKSLFPEEEAKPLSVDDEVKIFLNVLVNSDVDLSKFKILIFDVGMYNSDSEFINRLRKEIDEGDYPQWLKKNIKPVDISAYMDESMYFHLDGHINKLGHQKIANILAQEIDK